ncbi:MAG: hypothetical protein HWQ36_15820 [Nostoc sp. NMS2]|uniref:hypothetical protein n=1 Tax=Nostoc sp. NMS2 TaxID=2815389 RepID=UPI0025F0EFEA|nr:hypothetical protein [Nostoc sp. NMS2]MBN3991954.1 hypothetical protein [Nostoc sp. NMS2]
MVVTANINQDDDFFGFYQEPQDNQSTQLKYEEIEEKSQQEAKKNLDESWEKLDQVFSASPQLAVEVRRTLFEMFKNQSQRDTLKVRERWFKGELTRVSSVVGKAQGGLKFWEGGKISWPGSIPDIANTIFQWILKAGLGIVPVSSTMGILDPKILRNPDAETLENPFFWVGLLSGIALVELTSASIYNWFISQPSENRSASSKLLKVGWIPDWIKPIHVLVFLIWLAEALIGYGVLVPILKRNLGMTKEIAINDFEILLGVSMFALINVMFAMSKGERDNQVVKQKKKLNSLLEYVKHIKTEMNYCKQEAKKANREYMKYRKRYEELTGIGNSPFWSKRNQPNTPIARV